MTPTPDTVVQCIKIGTEVPLESVATGGTVVIFPLHSLGYLLNLSTGEQYDIPSQLPDDAGINDLEVSLDRNSLAYVESNENRANDTLWVITADGQEQATVAVEKEWIWWRWLDNERLEAYWYNAPTEGTVIVLNPFTGEKETIVPSFPDLYETRYDPPSWMVMYSPDLEWVLYLSNGDSIYRSGAVVWDVIGGKELWQLSGPANSRTRPAWSPKGDQVAVVVGGKLYRVDRKGQAVALPYLGELREVTNFSWSPDGHYIAFWAHDGLQGDKEWLLILDTRTNLVTDYCIDSASYGNSSLTWSPNGPQFLVDVATMEPDGSVKGLILLVDIKQSTAFEIQMSDYDYPVAWMRSIP